MNVERKISIDSFCFELPLQRFNFKCWINLETFTVRCWKNIPVSVCDISLCFLTHCFPARFSSNQSVSSFKILVPLIGATHCCLLCIIDKYTGKGVLCIRLCCALTRTISQVQFKWNYCGGATSFCHLPSNLIELQYTCTF